MPPVIRAFNLPYPRGATLPQNLGMLESPNPAIGPIVCAASTIDATGVSTGLESGRWSLPARIALAAFIALRGAILLGGPLAALLDYLLGQVLPYSAVFAADAGMADRLRLEAQAAATLGGHPNIVEVLDSGKTPAGRPYLVMERLQGRTLWQERTRRRAPRRPRSS